MYVGIYHSADGDIPVFTTGEYGHAKKQALRLTSGYAGHRITIWRVYGDLSPEAIITVQGEDSD